jgi:tetratricopeptide (TPR) repeat protein
MAMSYLSTARSFLLCLLITGVFGGISPVSYATPQGPSENPPPAEQPWLIQQVVQLQDRIAKLEVLLQQHTIKSGDIKSADKELQQLQLQLVELKEKLAAQIDNQSKELAFYDRRLSDVSWYTNFWGGVLAIFGLIITIAAIFMGFSAKHTAIREATDTAKVYLEAKWEELRSSEEAKFEKLRDKFEADIERLQTQSELQSDQLIAQSILNRALEYENDSKLDIAIATYDELISKFDNVTTVELKEFVALALVNKGMILSKLKLPDAEIASYDEVIRRFGAATELVLKALVAKALYRKGCAQGEYNQHHAAIATNQEVIRRFGDATELALKESLAIALFNNGISESKLERYDAAIACSEEVIRRFGDATESELKELVGRSYNIIGFRFLCDGKKELSAANKPKADELFILALQNFDKGLSYLVKKNSNGIILGNKSYTIGLLGNITKAEQLFAQALRATQQGGTLLYKGTLDDFDIHPVDQDKEIRAFVERQWKIWLEEQVSQ